MKNDLVINLKNKIILITGGYGHLGKGIVHSLLAHDAEVYVLGRSIDKFKEAFASDSRESLFFQHCDKSETLLCTFLQDLQHIQFEPHCHSQYTL